jgi:hypothetical protein
VRQDIFTGHSITQRGLVVRSEQSEIIIPLAEASKLFSAVQRATRAEPQDDDNRQLRTSLQRRMKLG